MTVPPPVNLLMTGTLSRITELTSRSSAGFLQKCFHVTKINPMLSVSRDAFTIYRMRHSETTTLAKIRYHWEP